MSGALGPCVKVGKKNREQRRFVRKTHMLARDGAGKGKKKCGWVKGRLR